jgi:hypothetical protein
MAPYAVGYGKPPAASRFQPGQSGNPNGRPKGRPTLHQILLEEGSKLIKVQVGDAIMHLPKQQAVIRKLYHKAMEGDLAAARLILTHLLTAEAAAGGADPGEPPLTDEELALLASLGSKNGGGSNG